MKRAVLLSLAVLFVSVAARADFVILHDGRSYAGTYRGAANGKLAFKDSAGIQYSFPIGDVQSLVFSNTADHIALRDGHSYTGTLLNTTSISFRGANGVGYVFPLSDVSSVIFTEDGSAPASAAPASAAAAPPGEPAVNSAEQAAPPVNRAATPGVAVPPAGAGQPLADAANQGATPSVVLPAGTQVTVRTDEAIDTTKDAAGQLYTARIEQNIVDSTGAVAIPAGTPAQLQVVNFNADNQNSSPSSAPYALALHSVHIHGQDYLVDSSSVTEKGSAGYGMNRRTAEYAGGGAGLGALLGAVFGGGKGAGIGALAGGGMGALTQYLTRGKQVKVPAESVLTFQLQHTLVLHP